MSPSDAGKRRYSGSEPATGKLSLIRGSMAAYTTVVQPPPDNPTMLKSW